MKKIPCMICGVISDCGSKNYLGVAIDVLNCPICGKYNLWEDENEPIFDKHKTKSFLCYNNRISNKITILRSDDIIKGNIKQRKQEIIASGLRIDPIFQEITELDIEAWYPKSFQKKVDMILLGLEQRNETEGKPIVFTAYEIIALLFLKVQYIREVMDGFVENMDNTQIEFYKDYFKQNDLLKICEYESTLNPPDKPLFEITILPSGYNRIYELQKNYSNSKDVFVAMSFDEKNEPISESIKKAIVLSRFSPKFMKEIIHNRQIVPEMLRLIRESKFLIMDISDPNYGAYFEAGYAMGLGKEVIITCKNEIFNKKDFKDWVEEKAFKPHFDIVQKQILKWENEEDLAKTLERWIISLIN